MNTTPKWWQQAVIYQIYPKSYLDTNGDGIGDLAGIISKLDYIKSLGVDAIWLSPVFKSPQDDNGYDISDYQDIDPMFGDLEEMKELLRQANARGIRIILDMVLNHTSDEHPWFVEARKSRDNPKHDWYVWVDGEPGVLPNDLRAAFGGSAWEWVPECGQYYLHQYSVKQPDLNWHNPEVRQALYDMMNWWIDQGAGGFRFDVIDSVAKIPETKEMIETPMLHDYIREMSAATLRGKNLVTVGEAWSANVERARLWSNPDESELSMVFQFQHIVLDEVPGMSKWNYRPLDKVELKRIMEHWQKGLQGKGWNSLFWENHDLPRIVSRWGDDGEYREMSAKMLATILFGMQGTPYIYQGQELGMSNTAYDLEEYRDLESLNMAKERLEQGESYDRILSDIHRKGRDNARTPMQWHGGENAGFSTGAPWLKVNPNHVAINVEEQEKREDSVLNYYRKLVALRKSEDVFWNGDYETVYPQREDLYAYRRKNAGSQLLVVGNFSGQEIDVPGTLLEGELLIANYPDAPVTGKFRPWEARMYLKK